MKLPGTLLGWVLKLTLGIIFLLAAWPKLRDPLTFAQQIENYQLLPEVAPFAAVILPGVELVIALVLILMPLRARVVQAAAAITALLMAAFTTAKAQVVIRGIDIDCGCFGKGTGSVSGMTIVRDILLVAAAVTVLIIAHRRRMTDRRRL